MADSPRAALWLSKDAVEGIRDLVQNRAYIRPVFDTSSSERPASSVMALAARVATKLSIEANRAYDVLFALWNLGRLRNSRKIAVADFLEEVSSFLKRQPSKPLEPEILEGWPETVSVLVSVLPDIGTEHPLFVSQKAQSLAYAHQNLVMSLRLITDVRPVFDEAGEQVQETMILHTLSIQYVSGHGDPVVTDFALDANDLSALKLACERAEKKLIACQESLRKADLNPVIVPEMGADR